MKRGALGKGIGALIPGKVESKRDYFECPLARIKPTPNQPRRTFDEETLRELSESISRSGIIQPLVVRQDGAIRSLRRNGEGVALLVGVAREDHALPLTAGLAPEPVLDEGVPVFVEGHRLEHQGALVARVADFRLIRDARRR